MVYGYKVFWHIQAYAEKRSCVAKYLTTLDFLLFFHQKSHPCDLNPMHNLIYILPLAYIISVISECAIQELSVINTMKSIFLPIALIALVQAEGNDTNPELPIPVNYCPHWYDIRSEYVANNFINEKYQASTSISLLKISVPSVKS